MSFSRFRLPRRRPSLRLQSPDHEWFMFHPDPDQPLVVSGFGEAASLAAIVMDLPVRNEMLVLLDEHRVVTAMLLDPPPEVGLFVGISSGAIMAGAVKAAGQIDEGTIVTIACDGGWKYLSTGAWTAPLDEVEARAKGIIYF